MTLSITGAVDSPLDTDDRNGTVGDLLDRARPRPGADHATVVSAADGYRASIPVAELRHGVLADGRLTIPAGRTLCWNVKDVVRIELTAGRQPDDVPEDPPH
ncbi:MAG TPA: hypothetical protein VFV35_04500 [Acidimicrobiales bacterium]|nr:hypothetical protein [Acidimicrobiales bacterium]